MKSHSIAKCLDKKVLYQSFDCVWNKLSHSRNYSIYSLVKRKIRLNVVDLVLSEFGDKVLGNLKK